MHILELPSVFTDTVGGFCLEQAKALQNLGHEVRILSLEILPIRKSVKRYISLPYRTTDITIDNIPIKKRYLRCIPLSIKHNRQNWINTMLKMSQDYILQYGKPDIIHAHAASWGGYTAMLIKKLYNIPYVITEHNTSRILLQEFSRYGRNSSWQIPLHREAYYNADMVIPVSQEQVHDLEQFYGNGYKYIVVSNVIDTDFFFYRKRHHAPDKFTFCCIAHFQHRKGYDILLPAFDKVCEKYPDCRLHIAGLDTDSTEFRKLTTEMKHHNNIIIHGVVDKTHVRDIMHSSNALVLASRSEAQNLSLLEAMSTGIPVISTPCIAESQKIGNAYSIVPYDNHEAMAQAMIELIELPKDCRDASKFIHDNYSAEPVAKKLTEIFNDIISKHHE